jgi:hypothetical protein
MVRDDICLSSNLTLLSHPKNGLSMSKNRILTHFSSYDLGASMASGCTGPNDGATSDDQVRRDGGLRSGVRLFSTGFGPPWEARATSRRRGRHRSPVSPI